MEATLFWTHLVLLSAAIVLHFIITFKALFYDPRLLLIAAGSCIMGVFVYNNFSELIGQIMLMIALLFYISGQCYYMAKDWSSRSLKILFALFILCAIPSIALVEHTTLLQIPIPTQIPYQIPY
ncbi:MAG: hypothetical protein ACRDD3_04725 [Azovibrio sp.]